MLHFFHRPLAFVLIILLIAPPASFAGGGITPDAAAPAGKRPGMDAAPNGVPVVNIAAPSASGLSHNQYTDFNVQKRGAVLNNSGQAVATELGGIVAGNPNLGKGAAKTILNEVTSANRSHIEGYIEVAGSKADVILANPNGVTINGGGFINTGRAVVTTGRPDVDGAGTLRGIDVRQGTVSVEGEGVNAANITGFDIVSRAARINAAVHARELSITTGQNRYAPATRTAFPLAPDGSAAPVVAIDSSALGGMYAGRIILTSTEKGVGVNLGGAAQSTGDMAITADGRLLVGGASPAGLAAGGSLRLEAAAVDMENARAGGQGDVRIAAGALSAKDSSLYAGRNLETRATGALDVRNTEIGAAGNAVFSGQAVTLDGSILAAGGDLSFSGQSLTGVNPGLRSGGDLRLNSAGAMRLTGDLLSLGAAALEAGGALDLADARAASGAGFTARGSSLLLDRAALNSAGDMALVAGQFLSGAGADLRAGRSLALTSAGGLTLAASELVSGDSLTLNAGAALALTDSRLFSGYDLTARAGSLALARATLSAGRDLLLRSGADILNAGGVFFSAADMRLESAGDITNEQKGLLFAGGNLSLLADGSIRNRSESLLMADGDVLVAGFSRRRAALLENDATLMESLGGNLSIYADTVRNLATPSIVAATSVFRDYYLSGFFPEEYEPYLADGTPRYTGGVSVFAGGTFSHYYPDSPLLLDEEGHPRFVDTVIVIRNKNGADFAFLPGEGREVSMTADARIEGTNAAYGAPDDRPDSFGDDFNGYRNVFMEWISGREEALVERGVPGQILAAGNIHIEADTLYNKESAIAAGGDISITVNTLENVGLELSRHITIDRQYGVDATRYRPYRDGQIRAWPLADVTRFHYTIDQVTGSVPALISAGGLLHIAASGSVDNTGLKQGAPYLGTGATNIAGAVGNPSATPGGPLVDLSGQPGAAGQPGLPSLPAGMGSLFNFAAAPGHKYLIETNPAFTSMGRFIGSEYFLSRLGYDLEAANMRLMGDAFFESRYIQSQVLEQTGKRFLYLGLNDAETLLALMDGAAAQGAALHLAVGVALTAEQVAQLSQDMVWLEEREVMGQKVLAPVLYLCEATLSGLGGPRGAALAGRDVVIETGELRNSGAIRADGQSGTLAIKTAGDMRNDGGELSGKLLVVDAGGSIVSRSGTISGGTVDLNAAEDVRLETAFDARRSGKGNADTLANQLSTLQADTLSITAGRDIALSAAQVTVEGAADLRAGNDVSLDAQAFNTRTRTTRGRETRSETQNFGSSLTAGELAITAGHDLSVAGSTVSARGDALLAAGNDLVLAPVTDSSAHSNKQRRRSDSETHNVGASVSAGGGLNMSAGHDLVVAGSSVRAEGDAALTAGHNLSVVSVLDTEQHKKGSSSNGWSSSATHNAASSITAGGDLALTAGADAAQGKGGIAVIGSELAAGQKSASGQPASGAGGSDGAGSGGAGSGTLSLSATGDVIIGAAREEYSRTERHTSTGFLSSSSSLKQEYQATSAGSTLSGNDVQIRAGDNVLITGSRVDAKNDLAVRADTGDVIVSASQDYSWSKKETKKSGFNLGNIGNLVVGLPLGFTSSTLKTLTGIPLYNDSVSADLYSKTVETSKKTRIDNIGSVLSAGHNLSMDAGRDVSVIGSAVAADNDIFLSAGRDVNLIPGREQYTSSYVKKKTGFGYSGSSDLSGGSAFLGVSHLEQGVSRTGDYTAGSLVSAGRDVSVTSGRDVNQIGSHIEAGRDVWVDAGQDWNMLSSYDRETLHQYVQEVRVGISASARENVSGAARALIDLPKDTAAAQGGAGYTAATATAAGAGLRAIDAVKGGLSELASGSATIGASFSRSDYRAESSTASPSSVTAGRDVAAGAGRDITIEGGRIYGQRDVILDAGRDVNIVAARDSGSTEFSSLSGGAGVGLKAGVGAKGIAFGINVNAHAEGAGADSGYGSHINSLVVAGDLLSVTSGRDTKVAGAHLEGERTWLDVGRDLTVASLQDSYDSRSYSWNAGVDVTVGYGVMIGGSLGYGQGKADMDWVGQQTSITGRGELDVYVEKNTHIKGGILATDPGGDLTLNTGTLSFEAIKDKNTSSDWHAGISGGFSVGGAGFDKDTTVDTGLPGSFGEARPYDFTTPAEDNKTSAPYLPDGAEVQYASHDKRGVVRPTVTEGEIIVRDEPGKDLSGLNRDLDRAREVTKDEKVNVDAYVSKGAVEEVINGGKNIKEMIDAYADITTSILEEAGLKQKAPTKEQFEAYYENIRQKALAQGKTEAEAELLVKQCGSTVLSLSIMDRYIAQYGSIENVPPALLQGWLKDLPLVPGVSLPGFGPGDVLEYTSGMWGEARQQTIAAASFMNRYMKGAISPLVGNMFPEDNVWAQQVSKEIMMLPVSAVTGEVSSQFRLALDGVLRDLNNAQNPYEAGVATLRFLEVTAAIFTPEFLAANPRMAAEFPEITQASKGLQRAPVPVPVKKPNAFAAIEVEGGAASAQNTVNMARLVEQLRLESANSPFLADGRLTMEVIQNAEPIKGLGPGQLKNPAIPSGFGKFTTDTFQSPSGNFQVHFYMNPSTGEVFYDLDYKAVFNSKSGVQK